MVKKILPLKTTSIQPFPTALFAADLPRWSATTRRQGYNSNDPPGRTTPPKTKECPLKKWTNFNRKYIFQPLIFREHVSFPGSILRVYHNHLKQPLKNRRNPNHHQGTGKLPVKISHVTFGSYGGPRYFMPGNFWQN